MSRRRDRLEALRAGLRGRRGSRLGVALDERLHDREHDRGDDGEVEDPPEQVAILDGVGTGERELRRTPVASRQDHPHHRHDEVVDEARDDLADRAADHDADGERQHLVLQQETPELGRPAPEGAAALREASGQLDVRHGSSPVARCSRCASDDRLATWHAPRLVSRRPLKNAA